MDRCFVICSYCGKWFEQTLTRAYKGVCRPRRSAIGQGILGSVGSTNVATALYEARGAQCFWHGNRDQVSSNGCRNRLCVQEGRGEVNVTSSGSGLLQIRDGMEGRKVQFCIPTCTAVVGDGSGTRGTLGCGEFGCELWCAIFSAIGSRRRPQLCVG